MGKTSDADLCRTNGWNVGTRLAGDEGYGETIIELTAIGEWHILAKQISHKGNVETEPDERHWTLQCRDWRIAETE